MVKINGQDFGHEYFPNHEAVYKKVNLNEDENTITMKFENNGDIATVFMAAAYIRNNVANGKLILDMPYIPYSAMDREINDQLFSLELFGQIINSLNFDAVNVMDPHNKDVTIKCINNIYFTDINEYIHKVIDDFKPDVIFFPDKGAMAKYPKELDLKGLPIIHGKKSRALEDKGRLLTMEVIHDDVDVEGKRVLIIDDICRKGGTFILGASELKKLGVGEIALYVSHCEACIFDGHVLDTDSPISRVYTNDSEPEILKARNYDVENYKKFKKVTLL